MGELNAHGRGQFWGADIGRLIVTNGEFVALLCENM